MGKLKVIQITLIASLLSQCFSSSDDTSRLDNPDVHPKLYAILKENQNSFHTIPNHEPYNCPKGNSANIADSPTTATSLNFYRPDPSLDPDILVQVTAFRVVTKCDFKWFGYDVKQVLSDETTSLSHIDPGKLKEIYSIISRDMDKMSLNHEKTEDFDQDWYNCEMMSFHPKEYEIFIIRYKVVTGLWDVDGHLVSPYLAPQCNFRFYKNQCTLDETTSLLWPSHIKQGCSVIPSASLAGVLYSYMNKTSTNHNDSYIDKFISASNKVLVTIGKSAAELDPLCLIDETSIIFSSSEGLLYSFRTHDSTYPFLSGKTASKSWTEAMKVSIASKSRMQFLNKIRESRSVKQPHNVDEPEYEGEETDESQRVTESRSSDEYVEEQDVSEELDKNNENVWIQPNLPVLKFESRVKRMSQSVTSLPMIYRDLWLEEHAAWSYSELEAQIHALSSRTADNIISVMENNCRQDQFLLTLARAVIGINERPYVQIVYGRTSFLSKTVDNQVYVNLGTPVTEIFLPNELKWCDGKLIVHFSHGDDDRMGLLLDRVGLIIENSNYTCESISSKPTFTIPLMKLGAYDVVRKQFVNSLDFMKVTNPDPIHPYWAPEYKVNDIHYREHLFRDSMSSLIAPAGSIMNGPSLFNNPSMDMSWLNYILSHVPLIITCLAFVIIFSYIISFLNIIIPSSRRSKSYLY